jgi:hypothetical protein
MSGSFADAHMVPEYRNILAAGLFATSPPAMRRMSRCRSQNWVEDCDDDMCWSTARTRLSSRRLARRAHGGPCFPRVQGITRSPDALVRIR